MGCGSAWRRRRRRRVLVSLRLLPCFIYRRSDCHERKVIGFKGAESYFPSTVPADAFLGYTSLCFEPSKQHSSSWLRISNKKCIWFCVDNLVMQSVSNNSKSNLHAGSSPFPVTPNSIQNSASVRSGLHLPAVSHIAASLSSRCLAFLSLRFWLSLVGLAAHMLVPLPLPCVPSPHISHNPQGLSLTHRSCDALRMKTK